MILHIMESAIKRVQSVQLLIDLQKIIKVEYFFLNVANHCIAVVDGYYYDTWESGSCCLYGYWEKE